MGKAKLIVCVASAVAAGALWGSPSAGFAEAGGVAQRVEKLEERVRDVEARLAKVEAMVNQHGSHPGQAKQGNQGTQPGSKGMGGGMMDDDMMGMPDPGSSGQAQPNPPGGAMGGGAGGMGDM